MPIFCTKTVHSHKNKLLSFFSNISLKTPLKTPGVHAHIWSKILQFCQNFTLWTKKSIGCLFFPIFHEKITALMPIYFHKNVHSLKTHCSHAHILSKKRPFFQKRCALMSIFSKFSSKTPCCHAHI